MPHMPTLTTKSQQTAPQKGNVAPREINKAPRQRTPRPATSAPLEGWRPRGEYRWSYLQGRMVELGYGPRDMARCLGVFDNTIYDWLRAEKLPRRQNLVRLAEVLKVDLVALQATVPIIR